MKIPTKVSDFGIKTHSISSLSEENTHRPMAAEKMTKPILKNQTEDVLFSGASGSVKRTPLQQLAHHYGIALEYKDVFQKTHTIPSRRLKRFLQAMGAPHLDNPREALVQLEDSRWRQGLEPVKVVKQTALQKGLQVIATLPESLQQQNLQWELTLENGNPLTGTIDLSKIPVQARRNVNGTPYNQFQLSFPVATSQIPTGYHTLKLSSAVPGDTLRQLKLIVVPEKCYLPPIIQQGRRVWGPAVQIYSLRSKQDWGKGDFGTLKQFSSWASREGAALVGINPVHALNLNPPRVASPYSPVSRIFLNPLYIDVEAVPEFEGWLKTKPNLWNAAFQQNLEALRKPPMVPYEGVSQAKLQVLEYLYGYFQDTILSQPQHARNKAFQAYVQQWQNKNGENLLKQFAVFQALQERFNGYGWPGWPPEYRNPDSAAVKEFERQNADRIGFYQYLQWLSDQQLHAAEGKDSEHPLLIGLYRDLAIGSDGGGFDTWKYQSLYAMGVTIGAPPDPLALQGQNWGLPPFIPHKLKEAQYQPVTEILRANMHYGGALRMDHAFHLVRLFWILQGNSAAKGAYVHYDVDDLMGIIALESHRNRCMVIGEDLGTAPEGFNEKMESYGLLSYKIARWERDGNREGHPYKSPGQYDQRAIVSFSTHDTSTLKGLLSGWLYHIWNQLKMISPEQAEAEIQKTDGDNRALLLKLQSDNLLSHDFQYQALQASLSQPFSQPLNEFSGAMHQYMAKTPSYVTVFQLEDPLQAEAQVNVPATTDGDKASAKGRTKTFPNWRNRFATDVDALQHHPGIRRVIEAMVVERGKAIP